jgi:predicted ester cyclase
VVAAEVTWTGTHDGPMTTPSGDIPATGKEISVDSTLWFQVEGDRAEQLRSHLDVLGLLTQIGVMPG